MSAGGLRNWRGEIVQSKDSDGGQIASVERQLEQEKKVTRVDEFGRTVEVLVDENRRKSERKDKKKERKHKHKKHKHRRDESGGSRSPSPQGRLAGTPPPPDPIRPQTKTEGSDSGMVKAEVEVAADATRGNHVVVVEAEVGAGDQLAHHPVVATTTVATGIGAPHGAEAAIGVATAVEVPRPLGLGTGARQPRWSVNGPTVPSTIAVRAHRDRLIQRIVRSQRRGCRERAASTCRANRSNTRKRRGAVCQSSRRDARLEMSTLLRDWDEGSKSKRKKLLEWFCGHFDPTRDGGGLLESECGSDVALFLPRLLSWMQKTTATAANDATSKPGKVKCFALAEQVACLFVFFGSANAHAYYREFQHADGLQLVLKIVAIDGSDPQTQKPLVSATDRETLLRIVLRISKTNRQCKEEISRLDGELAVIHGVLASGDMEDWRAESRVWTLCREVLLEQLVGNPNSLDRSHEAIVFMLRHAEVRLQLFGAQVLRELITDGSFSFDPEYRRRKERDLVPLCLLLVKSTDVYLQHESLELLHALLQSKHLQNLICEKLVRLVGDSAKALDAKVEERFAAIQDTTEHETYAHLRSAFAQVSQAVNTLMHSNRHLLPILVEQHGLLTPLAFVLVVERPHSLKWHAAAISIRYIFSHHYRGAVGCISELFEVPAEELLEWREKQGDDGELLAEFLLGDEAHQSHLALRFYQRGWSRPLSPRKQVERTTVDRVLNDIEYSVETAARDYVPELQVQTRVGEAADETEEMEILEAQREHHLRVQLQKHFAQFRHVLPKS